MKKFFAYAVVPMAFVLTGCHSICSVTAGIKPEEKVLETLVTASLLDPTLVAALCADVIKPRVGWSAKITALKEDLWEPLLLFRDPPIADEVAALKWTLDALRGDLDKACAAYNNGKTTDALFYLSRAKQGFATVDSDIATLEAVAMCSTWGRPGS